MAGRFRIRVDKDTLLTAIHRYHGNVRCIAAALHVSRRTIRRRIAEDEQTTAALKEAREIMLDFAEAVLFRKVLQGSTPELIFFLKTQGRNRGYGKQSDLSFSEGKVYEVSWDNIR